MDVLKRLAATLPVSIQNELKRLHFKSEIMRGRFGTWEPEYHSLPTLVQERDWVIDVGANVGHYTRRLSELVGEHGRVLAFEPIPETFALLAANIQGLPLRNVTLFNLAVSRETSVVGMSIPEFDTGLRNYYQAQLSEEYELEVMTMALDSLGLTRRVSLVKIDTEGHENEVLRGMESILKRDRPVLIVETSSHEIDEYLAPLGYQPEHTKGSPNVLFRHDHPTHCEPERT